MLRPTSTLRQRCFSRLPQCAVLLADLVVVLLLLLAYGCLPPYVPGSAVLQNCSAGVMSSWRRCAMLTGSAATCQARADRLAASLHLSQAGVLQRLHNLPLREVVEVGVRHCLLGLRGGIGQWARTEASGQQILDGPLSSLLTCITQPHQSS